ncbi:hypothetical protein LAUMK35_05435 [Mycobacterium pseudokansasii]|uniref:Uncharacterized protein n=1 Tax=Mycobacterium pseudokansasii TaxID=2341080 RepID=A0A498QZA9_9MYCO|nr:hypothetical protein LAUMK35_05435 [Mycobacterium pseudokansasii]VBA34927.1 hypothetical protein LAUMK21_05395 [Mycobacterium pseudokansasii]VBA56081.1 hypothetical protein LAUMK142_05391 [Mycobacterium pseudokansasii]
MLEHHLDGLDVRPGRDRRLSTPPLSLSNNAARPPDPQRLLRQPEIHRISIKPPPTLGGCTPAGPHRPDGEIVGPGPVYALERDRDCIRTVGSDRRGGHGSGSRPATRTPGFRSSRRAGPGGLVAQSSIPLGVDGHAWRVRDECDGTWCRLPVRPVCPPRRSCRSSPQEANKAAQELERLPQQVSPDRDHRHLARVPNRSRPNAQGYCPEWRSTDLSTEFHPGHESVHEPYLSRARQLRRRSRPTQGVHSPPRTAQHHGSANYYTDSASSGGIGVSGCRCKSIIHRVPL